METNNAESSKDVSSEEIASLEAQLKTLRAQSTKKSLREIASPQVVLVLVAVVAIGLMFMDSRGNSGARATSGSQAVVAQAGETEKPEVKVFDVVLRDSVYTPGTITVKRGDVVTINVDNKDNLNHGLHLPEYGVSQALTNLAVTPVTFVASTAGAAATSCGGTLASGDPHPESLNIVVL